MSLPRKPSEASEPLPTASKNSWECSKADASPQVSVLGIWDKADNLCINACCSASMTPWSPQLQRQMIPKFNIHCISPLHQSGLPSLSDALMPAIT